jgi:D-alanine-D-alanine ligase
MGEGTAVHGVLEEVNAVEQALVEAEYPLLRVPLHPPLEHVRDVLQALPADLVFNLFEGFDGCPETEALVADMLADLGFPFTGCPSSALALALDKPRTKALLQASGIMTAAYQVLTPETWHLFHLNLPCIVKPCQEDASHGLTQESVVKDLASLERQVAKVSRLFGGKALVEEFLAGDEFNATIIGNRNPVVMPISKIAYSLPPGMPAIFTFAAKWEPDSIYSQCANPICPAEIESGLKQRITETAIAAFWLLGCRGYARVDMRMDTVGRLMVLEVNPNPDISPGCGAARQAGASGMSYRQFIEMVVQLALEREHDEALSPADGH